MLFQSGALLTDLSVFHNVAFPLREHTDLPQRLIRTLVLMRLEAVGLRGARDLMPAALSGYGPARCTTPSAIAWTGVPRGAGHVDAVMEVPTISFDTRAEGRVYLVWRGPLAEGPDEVTGALSARRYFLTRVSCFLTRVSLLLL
jgi:predicted ABC-type transport system involved in lysophospholipase L1 biosynthesis ATPase subunit